MSTALRNEGRGSHFETHREFNGGRGDDEYAHCRLQAMERRVYTIYIYTYI